VARALPRARVSRDELAAGNGLVAGRTAYPSLGRTLVVVAARTPPAHRGPVRRCTVPCAIDLASTGAARFHHAADVSASPRAAPPLDRARVVHTREEARLRCVDHLWYRTIAFTADAIDVFYASNAPTDDFLTRKLIPPDVILNEEMKHVDDFHDAADKLKETFDLLEGAPHIKATSVVRRAVRQRGPGLMITL
jgi:hypothetical protein